MFARVWFKAHAVDGNDGESVGNGMPTHHGSPGLTLPLLFIGCVFVLFIKKPFIQSISTVILGFGMDSYRLALEALLALKQ